VTDADAAGTRAVPSVAPAESAPWVHRPRVGVSACLIGWEVRYSGGAKWTPAVAESLAAHVEWVPVCPEVEIGLGVPREAIELIGPRAAPELVGTTSRRIHTARLALWADERLAELEALRLSGWVFKARSPSCGTRAVPRREAAGRAPSLDGEGLFARAVRTRWPGFPIVEEEELVEDAARGRFLDAVQRFAAAGGISLR
jgi:uncharacterized protein YbbK (DUF523 family)